MTKNIGNETTTYHQGPEQPALSKSSGEIKGISAVKASNQTSKSWFIVAIIVGSLVVIGFGGFGIMGLLQSHHLISLPQLLSSAVGTIGNTPHFWSLWTMTVGGIVVGGVFIGSGAYNIHLIRKRADCLLEEKKAAENTKEQCDKLNENEEINNLEKEKVEIDFPGEFQIIEARLSGSGTSTIDKKFYNTQDPDNLNSAPIGDYCFIRYQEPYQILRIKGENKNLEIIVRESSQVQGKFRLILHEPNKGYRESSLQFTAAQLAAMTRHAHHPENGIRVSGLTAAVRSTSGLIIFTREDGLNKTYFVVNQRGVLQETNITQLIDLINKIKSSSL